MVPAERGAARLPELLSVMPMEVAIFTKSRTLLVQLLVDDPEQAEVIADHIQYGALEEVIITLDGTVISVSQTFDTVIEAIEAAKDIRDGMDDGELLNLDVAGVSEIARH